MRISKEEKARKTAINKQKELHHKDLETKQNEFLKQVPPYEGDSFISLKHINKVYPNHVQAVYDFNLDINEKEFVVFVGPSGCGKSTTLRMIAGLEDITYGSLYIDKEFANTLLPKSRDCAMVFQNYALYPNMTVYDNMAFSLKVRHLSRKEINAKVMEAAKILELEDYLARKPSELSGGQRQRVALGRAIVRNAKVFLMDEPLSNLDAKLRVQMRSEIVSIHERIGATTIYVTHDQTEAMTMADKIVVMKDGYIQQIGTPKEIYNHPANMFVAGFIGAPATNMLLANYDNGKVILKNNIVIKLTKEQNKQYNDSLLKEIELLSNNIKEIEEENRILSLPKKEQTGKLYKSSSFRRRIPDIIKLNEEKIVALKERIKTLQDIKQNKKQELYLGVRPEDIVSKDMSKIIEHHSNLFKLFINQAELLGNEYYVHSSIDEDKVVAKVNANEETEAKTSKEFAINTDKIHLFDKESTKAYF